jgi:ABC-type Mn2+/Zn2+ transport system permease subunit
MGTTEIVRIIIEEFPYAFYGSILVGVLCSFLGVYVVAKRVVFLGAVLTQVSVAGLALTFLPLFAVPHTVGSLIVTVATVIVLSRVLTGKQLPKDSVLGFVFVFAVASRILILQKAPKVEVAEVDTLLRGDILFVTPELFYLMAGVFIVALSVHLLFYKEFTFISFDPETAGTQGYNVVFWETLFYVLAAVVIAVATHMVGDVFVFGFLVVPAVSAMIIGRTIKNIFLVAVFIGALAPMIGLYLAFVLDLPSSPTMVCVAVLILALFSAWRFVPGSKTE